jgi:hypothetical protein
MRYSIVPLRRTGKGGTVLMPCGQTAVTPQTLPLVISELSRDMGNTGTVQLFLPGCFAPAAPCLLFRLKRSGYSGSRATLTRDGLLLTATR